MYLGTVADRLTGCRGQLGILVQWIDETAENQVAVGSRRL